MRNSGEKTLWTRHPTRHRQQKALRTRQHWVAVRDSIKPDLPAPTAAPGRRRGPGQASQKAYAHAEADELLWTILMGDSDASGIWIPLPSGKKAESHQDEAAKPS